MIAWNSCHIYKLRMFPFALTYFLRRFNWTSSISWYFPSYSNIIVPMETFGVWMTGWMVIWYWLGSNWQRWWLNGGLWVIVGEKLAEMVERELDDGWEREVWMMGSTMDYGATWLNQQSLPELYKCPGQRLFVELLWIYKWLSITGSKTRKFCVGGKAWNIKSGWCFWHTMT